MSTNTREPEKQTDTTSGVGQERVVSGDCTGFSNGKWAVTVECVADLIKELSRLPPDMMVKDGIDGADLVVFNRKGPNAFIDLDDAGMWDSDYEFRDVQV
jgi:hypothetical protein